jgi:hypothetical protein
VENPQVSFWMKYYELGEQGKREARKADDSSEAGIITITMKECTRKETKMNKWAQVEDDSGQSATSLFKPLADCLL